MRRARRRGKERRAWLFGQYLIDHRCLSHTFAIWARWRGLGNVAHNSAVKCRTDVNLFFLLLLLLLYQLLLFGLLLFGPAAMHKEIKSQDGK